MKVLIKRREEDSYLVRVGLWSETVEEARDFRSLLAVLDFRREHRLEKVDAFFLFEDPQYNFVLKMG
jgi:hypothetical protein